jgi:5-oxoprolinase (ATP-hydrolysing) subunit C
MIEVLTNGALNIVVDSGRHGLMGIGVSHAGPMDALALDIANALVGNDRQTAGIEVSIFPFRIAFSTDTVIAITGAPCVAELGQQRVPPYWATVAQAGDILSLQPPEVGARAYLVAAGGFVVSRVMGSQSTDVKGAYGGLHGRALRRGDRLTVGLDQADEQPFSPSAPGFGALTETLSAYWRELATGNVRLRVMQAAEYNEFTEQARLDFAKTPYQVTLESNRIGTRLRGAPLGLRFRRELLSHGIVPGTVQVPPSGDPIIQLVEANTCGGYPKIATVIECDLWKCGQVRPGTRLTFQLVDVEEAIDALQRSATELQELKNTLVVISQRY